MSEIQFEIKKSIRSGSILVTVPREVLMDKPFPAGPITLTKANLNTQGGTDIVFGGDGKGDVNFRGTASALLRVNDAPETVIDELGFTGPLAAGLSLSTGGKGNWATLQWSYNAQAAAQGAVALGAGAQVTAGADTGRSGAFAILHRFEPSDPAQRVLEDLVASWQLPRQVHSPDDLRPCTWLITEVAGSLALNLGVRYGYLFNWLRQIKGGLAGDIGLRLQLGLEAKVGLKASDRYALVLSRPSTDAVLHLQLFRQGTKGWNVDAHAAAGAQGDLGKMAPETPEALLRAILNVHEGQILSDLQEWLDPKKDLGAMLSKAGVDYAKKFLTEVTGIDAVQKLEEARGQLSTFLEAWNNLDQRAASALWTRLGQEEGIQDVLALAQDIHDTLGNEDKLRDLLERKIQELNFQTSAAGRWLSAQATETVLQLIQDSKQLQRLYEAATQTLAIQDEMLKVAQRLKTVISDRFGIDKIVSAADPESLDAWLRGRLEELLGDNPAVRELNQIKKAIEDLRSMGNGLYEKTRKALVHQYRADFASTYQKTTERTALIDVELDFANDHDAVSNLLACLLSGNLDNLFVDGHSGMRGVTLNQAALTHEIRRELHIDLTLPWSRAEMWHENKGLAEITVLHDGGRLLLCKGTDEAHFATAKMHRDSRLSLAAQLTESMATGAGLRHYEKPGLTYSYSFHQAKKDMGTGELKAQVGAYVDKYLANQFPPGALSRWADDLERKAAKGAGKLGNTLIELELSVPPAVGKAWLYKSPEMGSEPCMAMSLSLQKALKKLIPFYYFHNLEAYGNVGAAAPLLVWAAIPAMNRGGDGLHWSYTDKGTLREMVDSPETCRNLERELGHIHAALNAAGLPEIAKRYQKPKDKSHTLRDTALTSQFESLDDLLNLEARIVRGAAKAADKLANFRRQPVRDPERAIKALAELASILAESFNHKVWSVYGKGALRPLGTLLFTEAARAFDPENPELTPEGISALLRIEILKSAVPFPPAGFPDDSALTETQVQIGQTIVILAPDRFAAKAPSDVAFSESPAAPAELVHV